MKKQFFLLSMSITIAFLMAGCISLDPFNSAVEQTIRVLEDAETTLNQNSSDWQMTLINAIGKLTQDAQSTTRNELSNMLQRGIASTSGELRCDIDFVGKRIAYNIQVMIAKLRGSTIPGLPPYLCNVVPAAIDAALVPARLNLLEFFGYDFDMRGVSAFLIDNNGSKTDITSKLNRTTHYHMTLNLGGNGVQIAKTSKSINLYYNNEELSSIAVIQPATPICLSNTAIFYPGSFTYIPPHTRGDGDFDGNGPDVNCSVTLSYTSTTVTARIYMNARETESDWTTSSGSVTRVLYTAPAGYIIQSLSTPLVDTISYSDSNHSDDVFERGTTGPVQKYTFVGDTDGDEAGNRTKVTILFNGLRINLKQSGNCVSASTLQMLNVQKLLSPSLSEKLDPNNN